MTAVQKTIIVVAAISLVIVSALQYFGVDNESMSLRSIDQSETMKSQDLIVIAAPSVNNNYYQENFQDIIDFDIAYANAVSGRDEIRILVDSDTRRYFKDKVPEDILIEAEVADIWMRDFTTVNPYQPVQFRYTAASLGGDQKEADYIQETFNDFIETNTFAFPRTELRLDGGNIVDNYEGKVITTTRFLEDNDLTKAEGVKELKRLLGATEVAILPPDDDVLAHSDGMVTFIDSDTLVVNQYDEPFRTAVLQELETAFPGITIVEVPVVWDNERWDGTIGSACGVNVNAVVTTSYIYVPHFGDTISDQVVDTISAYTNKTVVPVPAERVCKMGGSVRCLSWQLSGEQASVFLSKLP